MGQVDKADLEGDTCVLPALSTHLNVCISPLEMRTFILLNLMYAGMFIETALEKAMFSLEHVTLFLSLTSPFLRISQSNLFYPHYSSPAILSFSSPLLSRLLSSFLHSSPSLSCSSSLPFLSCKERVRFTVLSLPYCVLE